MKHTKNTINREQGTEISRRRFLTGAAATAAGYPGMAGGLAKAPFDTLGDTLRGTRGIMMDMFQRPDKLQEAMERLVPLVIDSAIGTIEMTGTPMIFFPLHKGADGFMSTQQFQTFYWPPLKKVIMALVNEGILPDCRINTYG